MPPGIRSPARQASQDAGAASPSRRPRLVVLDKLTNQPVTNYYDSAALTWQDCKSIVAHSDIHRLNRSDKELVRYKAWGNHIKQSYASMESFILSTVFAPPPHRPGAPPKIVLRANDFPYNLRPEIEHWVLWADCKLGEQQIKAVVTEWLLKVEREGSVDAVHYPEDEEKVLALSSASHLVAQESSTIALPEWVYWVNPPERQTIPGVWHAHILVNRE